MNEPRSVMLQLPWPPSINSYWKRTKFGSVYVSKDGGKPTAWPSSLIRRLQEAAARRPCRSRCEVLPAEPSTPRPR